MPLAQNTPTAGKGLCGRAQRLLRTLSAAAPAVRDSEVSGFAELPQRDLWLPARSCGWCQTCHKLLRRVTRGGTGQQRASKNPDLGVWGQEEDGGAGRAGKGHLVRDPAAVTGLLQAGMGHSRSKAGGRGPPTGRSRQTRQRQDQPRRVGRGPASSRLGVGMEWGSQRCWRPWHRGPRAQPWGAQGRQELGHRTCEGCGHCRDNRQRPGGWDDTGGHAECPGAGGSAQGPGSRVGAPHRQGSDPREGPGTRGARAARACRHLRSPSAPSRPAARSTAGSRRPAAPAPGPGTASCGTGGSGPRSRGSSRRWRGGRH